MSYTLSTDRKWLAPKRDQNVEIGVFNNTLKRKKRLTMLQYFSSSLLATLSSKKGISALEYAILAGVLVGVISTAVTTFGSDITSLFTAAGAKLTLP